MTTDGATGRSADSYVNAKFYESGGEGRTPSEALEVYKTWAGSYEQDVLSANYRAHVLVAECLQQCFSPAERGHVKILDVGAGTGLVGQETLGFKHVDALDPSSDMLEMARAHNRYEDYFRGVINADPLNIPENTYDAVSGSGIYMEGGHAPVEALYEMIRLVKPGGYVVLATRVSLVEHAEMYRDLEPLMQKLECEGRWKKLKGDTSGNLYSDREGIVFLFQVL